MVLDLWVGIPLGVSGHPHGLRPLGNPDIYIKINNGSNIAIRKQYEGDYNMRNCTKGCGGWGAEQRCCSDTRAHPFVVRDLRELPQEHTIRARRVNLNCPLGSHLPDPTHS